MADDVKGLILQVSASTELLRSQLIRAEDAIENFRREAEQSANAVDNRFERMGRPLAGFEGRMRQATNSIAQQRAAFQQLGFQMQDVAAQLSTGTSPFIILAQQGGQTAAALSGLTGVVGRFASFMSGPFGAAILVAVSILGSRFLPAITGTEKALDAQGDATDALTESTRVLNQVVGTATKTAAQARLEAIRNTTDRLNEAAATRDAARAELELAQAKLASLKVRSQLPNERGDVAALAVPGQMRDIRQMADDLSKADAKINAARNSLNAAFRENARLTAEELKRAKEGASAAAGVARGAPARGLQEAAKAAEALQIKLTPIAEQFDGILESDDRLSQRAQEFYRGIGLDPMKGIRDAVDNGAIDPEERVKRDQSSEDFWKDFEDRGQQRIQTLANIYEQAFSGAGGNFWDQFKQNGIRVLANVLAQFTAAQFGGGGGGGFNLGSAFSTALSDVFGGMFAGGGTPPVGRASIVGERGPELFVPRVPGSIIPNHMMRPANDTGPIVNYTINAPGATAETVAMIKRELAAAAPGIAAAGATLAKGQDAKANRRRLA